ncbi:hypothetical protein ACTXN7_06300 [Corynebacterium flavescens]|uniref:hypothetical protein n=1 Tax=Corynebacterium flavescens TaxID=28028 RepID=UPI003FD428C2
MSTVLFEFDSYHVHDKSVPVWEMPEPEPVLEEPPAPVSEEQQPPTTEELEPVIEEEPEPSLEDRITEYLEVHVHLSNSLRAELFERGEKLCYSCSSILPLESFGKLSSASDGLATRCKQCSSHRVRAYYSENREAIRKRSRDRYRPVLKAPCFPVARKQCPGCLELKAWTEYSKRRRNNDGLESRCTTCTALYYQNNKQHRDAYTNHYRSSTNPWAERLSNGYTRAINAGAPAEKVTTAELLAHWEAVGIDPGVSVYSGTKLEPSTLSLDHTTPLSKPGGPGHVVTNLVPCLKHENDTKTDMHFVNFLGKVHGSQKEAA